MTRYEMKRVLSDEEILEITDLVKEGLKRLNMHHARYNYEIEKRREYNKRARETRKRKLSAEVEVPDDSA